MKLIKLKEYVDDKKFAKRWFAVKTENKQKLADLIKSRM